jgi:hypothetical protein
MVYMTPSAAAEQHLERVSKYPKSSKFGRQNPITERWNSEEQLIAWRKAWEETVNHALEKANRTERVDSRSYADRGIDEQPTIHEGPAARKVEEKGGISDRCEMNRVIRYDNILLREAKAHLQWIWDKIRQAAERMAQQPKTIAELAESLETKFFKLVCMDYTIKSNEAVLTNASKTIDILQPKIEEFRDVTKKVNNYVAQRKQLEKELSGIGFYKFSTKKQIRQRIEETIQRINECQNKQIDLLSQMGCRTIHDFPKVEDRLARSQETEKSGYDVMKQQRKEFSEEVGKYRAEKRLVTKENAPAVTRERSYIHGDKWQEAHSKLKKQYGEKFSPLKFMDSEKLVQRTLDENPIEFKERPKTMEQNQPPKLYRKQDFEL